MIKLICLDGPFRCAACNRQQCQQETSPVESTVQHHCDCCVHSTALLCQVNNLSNNSCAAMWASDATTSSHTNSVYFALSRKAIRFCRSAFFFSPANIIFVPGMYFFGFSRYTSRVSALHTMPGKTRNSTMYVFSPRQSSYFQISLVYKL